MCHPVGYYTKIAATIFTCGVYSYMIAFIGLSLSSASEVNSLFQYNEIGDMNKTTLFMLFKNKL